MTLPMHRSPLKTLDSSATVQIHIRQMQSIYYPVGCCEYQLPELH